MTFVPRKVFFTNGVGRHRNELESFELALRDASIEKYNLVTVSSIHPAGCEIVNPAAGALELTPGQVVFCVMARASTNEPNRLVGAGIGLAVPAAGDHYGYLSEHHGYGMTKLKLSDYVEDMAATMLATTLGIEFDPDSAYDERREVYKMSGKIVQTRACVQTAAGDKEGRWTTVVASAVFLM
ncbi:MAG: arginine decarboxylase, pyruvoyl-dependent [Planctomycetota bacterium]|nr:arginine decarboxylase, pyruvoyl-dependent [Planctomycetota bacterium]MDA1141076.1 arginine decarboxylase, pyruvoyl-dependent [Planctomycetota bacterium]